MVFSVSDKPSMLGMAVSRRRKGLKGLHQDCIKMAAVGAVSRLMARSGSPSRRSSDPGSRKPHRPSVQAVLRRARPPNAVERQVCGGPLFTPGQRPHPPRVGPHRAGNSPPLCPRRSGRTRECRGAPSNPASWFRCRPRHRPPGRQSGGRRFSCASKVACSMVLIDGRCHPHPAPAAAAGPRQSP